MSLRENSRSCSMVDAYVVRKRGYFGQFGGQYVPETLMPALHELEAAYDEAKEDPKFQEELESYNRHYGGGPAPPPFSPRPSGPHPGGAGFALGGGPPPSGGPHTHKTKEGEPPPPPLGGEERGGGRRAAPARDGT